MNQRYKVASDAQLYRPEPGLNWFISISERIVPVVWMLVRAGTTSQSSS